MAAPKQDAMNRMFTRPSLYQIGKSLLSKKERDWLFTLFTLGKDSDMRKISMAAGKPVLSYFSNLVEAKKTGRKVVFVSFNMSPEIFHALDMIPLCIEGITSMAPRLEEGTETYLDLAVESGLPDTMCSGHRGAIGMLEAGILEKPDMILNCSLGGCDPNTKALEYMAKKFDIPAVYLDIPFYHDERALDYFTAGFKKVVAAFEELSGNKLDEDRLREVCEYSNQATELFFEINDLKRNVPNPVPGFYNLLHTMMKLSMTGTKDAVDFYRKVIDISKKRLEKGKGVKPEEKVRALFSYTSLYFDPSFFTWLEYEVGVSYLVEYISFFDSNPLIDTTNMETMIRGMAEVMLNYPMTRQNKGTWDMPANWLSDVLHYAEAYKADCCIFSGHLACKQIWGMYRLVADRVKKDLGIPTIRLEGDGWDPRITPLSVIKEQLLEFFETLE